MTELRNQINNIVEDYNACKVLAESVGNPSVYEGTTATAEDIALGKTAYVNGEKVVGTLVLNTSNHNATIVGISAFNIKKGLTEVDLTGVTLSVTTTGVFQDCSNLETVKGLDLSTSSNLYNGFSGCIKLKDLDINNTQNITNWQYAFKSAVAIQDLKQLRGDKANNMGSCFQSCSNLTNFGGFLNLGKAYTGTIENNLSYKLDLSSCTKLTHESLMNVINGLYDLNLTYKVADGGTLYRQSLVLGATNLAKLQATEEGQQAIAIATNKGWNVS